MLSHKKLSKKRAADVVSVSGGEELPLVVLSGATASGKTRVGVELALRLGEHGIGAEIINADSMQFYRGMDIGTAKITAVEMRGVPHHYFDVLDVTDESSVADYQTHVRPLIQQIRGRGNVPIMVGGSGLYIRAAIDTIEFPPTDSAVREHITQRLDTEGVDALRAQLQELDPVSAATITDERRIIRALEVITITGRPFSSYMPERNYHQDMFPVIQIGIRVPREILHQRIQQRVEGMARLGFLEEVRQLEALGLRNGRTASRAIGYQQFLDLLDEKISQEAAIESTTIATRKLARRQETWFKADPRIQWIGTDKEIASNLDDMVESALHLLSCTSD